MRWLPPLDHAGQPVPVPTHHLFSCRTQGLQLLTSFVLWTGILSALMVFLAVYETRELDSLVRVAPEMMVRAATFALVLTFLLVAMPLLSWPWSRREYGRQLVARIEQMSMSELDQMIEQCDRELDSAASTKRAAAVVAWRQWLETKRASHTSDGAIQPHERLTLRPSRRNRVTSAACGGVFLVIGLWLILLAIIGGDGGTGIVGFSGPNAFWTKLAIGCLMVVVTVIPLVEAFTVRVDLTASELRKRGWGRLLWSIPRAAVSLVPGDEGCWEVFDARNNKRVGELNPQHFEDDEFLAVMGLLRPVS
jgi:hypothetical protein